jgi:CheY-like chemotaxis protein
MPSTPPPSLMLLEDDPVSARFLRDALAPLAVPVDHVETIAEAEHRSTQGHALWLFDAWLPDGHSGDLLVRLRARGLATPAIALTADAGDAARERLVAAGFAAVMVKPLDGPGLRAAVAARLPSSSMPAWDDAAAHRALGSGEAVTALRALFLAELAEQRRRVHAAVAASDPAGVGELLHRLTSSCGFVGASALREAVRALAASPGDAAALAHFDACAAALVER